MRTIWLLMAKCEGQPTIPLDTVIADYLPDFSRKTARQKIESGEIPIPVVIFGRGQKAARMVHIEALAAFIDKLAVLTLKEVTKKSY